MVGGMLAAQTPLEVGCGVWLVTAVQCTDCIACAACMRRPRAEGGERMGLLTLSLGVSRSRPESGRVLCRP